MPPPDSALILFPGALGDFLCFLPTLLALRRRHAGDLLLVAKTDLCVLVRLPRLRTASMDRRAIAQLFSSGQSLDAETIDLFTGYARAYSWTGAGHDGFAPRLASATGGRVDVYPFRDMRLGEHAVEYYARCAGVVPLDVGQDAIVTDGSWLATFLTRHDLVAGEYLVFHPGSGSAAKNWQGFGALTQQLRGDRVVVLRGPAERGQPSDGAHGHMTADGLSLPQVAALLRRSHLYVGNDSGVSHLAAVVGARGVVLFGPSDPAAWAPRGGQLRILRASRRCAACPPAAFCVHRLPVEEVLQRVAEQRRGG